MSKMNKVIGIIRSKHPEMNFTLCGHKEECAEGNAWWLCYCMTGDRRATGEATHWTDTRHHRIPLWQVEAHLHLRKDRLAYLCRYDLLCVGSLASHELFAALSCTSNSVKKLIHWLIWFLMHNRLISIVKESVRYFSMKFWFTVLTNVLWEVEISLFLFDLWLWQMPSLCVCMCVCEWWFAARLKAV